MSDQMLRLFFSSSYLVCVWLFGIFVSPFYRLPANRLPDTCVDIVHAAAALDLQFRFRLRL